MKKNHLHWINRCIELAEIGRGHVSPNPMVGACVVKNGKLIAEGWHPYFGGPHAEAAALRKAGPRANGASLYVSLEPCSTFGKTPACTETIIKSGIREVVIGVLDPNPRHHKKGIAILKKAGIKVTSGILADQAAAQNESFFTFHKKKRPFVAVKMAESLDGKITTVKHSREWISGLEAREWTHRLREEADALIVGTQTIKVDNPRMTPYLLNSHKPRKPLRVVLDRSLTLGKSFKVFGDEAKTIVFTSAKQPKSKIENYSKSHRVDVFPVRETEEGLEVKAILKHLYRLGITSMMVEGGGELIASFLKAKAVDKFYMFVAPFILGGRNTVTSVEGDGIPSVKNAIRLKDVKHSKIGGDILIEGRL